MTMTALPATTEREQTDRYAHLDTLVAKTLPYVDGAYGNEARDYLKTLGLTDDEIHTLVVKKTLGA